MKYDNPLSQFVDATYTNSMRRCFIWFFILFVFGDFAYAQVPMTFAVQRRPYHLQHEISGTFSYLPLDNFNIYYGVGGAYTRYINDYVAWEVVNFQQTKESPTGLDSFLLEQGALPDEQGLDVLKYYATTNVVYTPFYTKSLFGRSKILWGDLSLVGGFGVSKFEKVGMANTIDLGGFIRFFISQAGALKLDVRNLFYLNGGLKPNLSVGISYAYHFSDEDLKSKPVEDEE